MQTLPKPHDPHPPIKAHRRTVTAMARPKSTEELKDFRFQIMLRPSEVEAIDDWMFSHRLKSRAEAMRQLIELGLRADIERTEERGKA